MKTNTAMRPLRFLFALGLFAVSGCYTVLMHPSMLTSSEEDSNPPTATQGDFTSEISYNQNCLNCHSQAELDDRYYDMGRAGMHYAHGISIDPYGWQRPTTSLPWWDGVLAPIPSTTSSSPSTTESGPRRRSSGATRGGERQRVSTSQSETATTNTTTSTAPATSPAVSDTRRNTPSSTPSTTTERTRSTSAPAKEAPSRKSGSTRGDDPK